MINDLADMGRLEMGQMKLNRSALDLLWFLGDLKGRSSDVRAAERIRLEVPADLPPILADQDCLERVFTNLLSNTLKYSDGDVTVKAEPSDGQAILSVIDRGSGISQEEIPHIFERFYSARGVGKKEGLGLGLYIVKGLVEAHGGEVWVESRIGEGCTFGFTLPAVSES